MSFYVPKKQIMSHNMLLLSSAASLAFVTVAVAAAD